MKKVLALSAVSLAVSGSLFGQGLYNIMPYDDDPVDALPLEWVAGVNLGYDDNVSPNGTELPGVSKDDSMYVGGFIQANYANVQPQTTYDFWGRVGLQYYIDDIERGGGTGGTDDQVAWDLGVGFNITHRYSERLRFRSRNSMVYQIEPDYTTSFGPDRRVGQYFRYSTDNSVGYSWTERFATVTGFRLNGVIYDDIDDRDVHEVLIYNQFRYRLSPATVLTASYRYGHTNNETGRDSDRHYILVGAEHRFSPTTVGVIRGGVTFFDGNSSHTAPYLEGTLRVRTNEQFSFRGFIRYGYEDRGTFLNYTRGSGATFSAFYDERITLRLGTQATYDLSPDVTLFGGINVVLAEYDDLDGVNSDPGAFSSIDEQLFNLNIGGSYRVMENVFVNGSYVYTNSGSDARSREYDRNRFNLGVRTTF